MRGYLRSTAYFVLNLSKEINFSLRRQNNVFGLVTSLRDVRSGLWFPARERYSFFLQIVHNILVSTRSPAQGVLFGKSDRLMMLTTCIYILALMACTKTTFHLPVSNQHILYFTVNSTCVSLTHKMFITH
jgi:hypothetical protein